MYARNDPAPPKRPPTSSRQQRDELDVWMATTAISQGGTEEEYNRRYQAIGQAETDEVGRRAMRFGSALEDIAKVRNRGLRDIDRNITLDNFRTQGATAASRLRTQTGPSRRVYRSG
jgi:hypothetical protein